MNTRDPDSECRSAVLLMLGRKDFKRRCLFHFFSPGAKLLTVSYLKDSITFSPVPDIHMQRYWST